MKHAKFKNFLAYTFFAGTLGLSSLGSVNAQTSSKLEERGCSHMGAKGNMGMMMDCMGMMQENCPMMDDDATFTITETSDGMIVKWVGQNEDSIKRIQNMGEHMKKMRKNSSR